MTPGSIVRFRARDWVLLPGQDERTYALRPLTGAIDEEVLVHKELSNLLGYSLPEERIRPSIFLPPSPNDVSDAASAHLLWQAARLTLREGAAPFRSLGRISIRPRVYQFVPLLMALRLDPVRLFIADDVGVGKTIEALLIARELIDRGEIRRLAVLCPPYLCDQWHKELREKFNLEAVVINSSTIGQLEREKPLTKSLYEYYPYQVISIDWVKSERNKYQFLQFCPELVIVDEAHGAAESGIRSQQQRHQLLREIAGDERRHLILLTATPHSGVKTAFQSLLGLLRPEFATWDVSALDEAQRAELARHFVQRTRKNIEQDWEGVSCFPKRISLDETYTLSDEYRKLFEQTYRFCSEVVRTGKEMEEFKRRVRYWGALALLRCVMSSPAAAVVALGKRAGEDFTTEEDANFSPFIFEATDQTTDDEAPTPPIEAVEGVLAESERDRLRKLARQARKLLNSPADTKFSRCLEVVRSLLQERFNPIIWCRYVATAEYVAEGLRQALGPKVQVTAITGRMPDEERRLKIDEISPEHPRVLVATDCLSEGINLQKKFNAVIHYDLPWNPNRLEQREGRVDRFGQTAKVVKAIRFYGRDNPVDGAVIQVLLEKAKEIYKALGTYVPVPEESETVMQAVLNALFLRGSGQLRQQSLFGEEEEIKRFHQRWEEDAQREKLIRTRFAQRALKPEEVKRELEATDAVLGDPDAVKDFVLEAGKRLGLEIRPHRNQPDVFLVNVSREAVINLPEAIRFELPETKDGLWRISFVSPTPEGAEYVGRNHRFVTTLARFLLEEALTKGGEATASRCGVLRTRAVEFMTTLFLLRVRYLVEIPGKPLLLSEEVLVTGYQWTGDEDVKWLSNDEAQRLLSQARPEANIPLSEKRELVSFALEELGEWEGGHWGEQHPLQRVLKEKTLERARELEASHKRIRKAVSLRIRELKVKPQFPPDLLGLLILQPVVWS